MGMYTQFHYNVELKKDTPEEVILMLRHMVGDIEDTDTPSPDHPLFGNTRWGIMLRCDSYYFSADTHSTMRFDEITESWFLNIQCNLKNYSDEINLFLDWITPYINEGDDSFLGYYMYEEAPAPALIFAPNRHVSVTA